MTLKTAKSWVVTPKCCESVPAWMCPMRMEAVGTAKRWCAFTRIYGVTPQKSIRILYLEVCRFDVKGNEEGTHE